MNRFARIFFIVLAINLSVVALGLLDVGFLVLVMLAVPVEMLVGFALLFSEKNRETGLAILAAGGVALLLAGFICSTTPMHFQ